MTTSNSLWRQIANNLGVVGSQFTTTNSILKQIARVRGVINPCQTENALLRQIARTYGITTGLMSDNAILKLIARNLGNPTGLTTDNSILKLIKRGLHPDTLDYVSRVVTAGGTVSTANQIALNAAISSMYAQNLVGGANPLKYFLCHILTSSFTGCLVPVYNGGVGNPTNLNFVAGDWSATLGLTGNGIDKSLRSNYILSTSLGNFTLGGRSDFHFGAWVTNFSNPALTGEIPLMGMRFSAANKYLLCTSTDLGSEYTYLWGRNGFYELRSGVSPNGFVLGNTPSETNIRILTNGTLQAQNTIASTAIVNPTLQVALFARNNSGTNDACNQSSVCMWTAGGGLNSTQETALYNILNTLKTALGA
jgi:hypothetical protein